MRIALFIITSALVFLSCQLFGQDLLDGRRSSYYTFIYKVSNDQAKKLYKEIWDLDTTYLTNPYDFFPTDSAYKRTLPVGHFIFVKAKGEVVETELKSVNNVTIHVLNNHRDLMMVFSDSMGREVPGLKVSAGAKEIPFDKDVRAYRVERSNKRGVISVVYGGHVSFFALERKLNNRFIVRTGRKIPNTFPINHIISPVLYVKNTIQRIIQGRLVMAPGIYYRVRNIFSPTQTVGYMVLNKPKYKPYDTLRLKAILTTKKGRPAGVAADVFLSSPYPDEMEKKVGRANAYRKGAYHFELFFNDSLNLKLDKRYWIELRNRKGKTLLSTSFEFEEYQLKNNFYTVRKEHINKLRPGTLFLKGEDSNGMPLFDVRAEVLIKPKSLKQYYRSRLFVPDTLWFHRLKLDPIGETKIDIPDSVVSDMDLDYEAVVAFYNSENERTVKTLIFNYEARPFPLVINVENDSIKVKSLDPRMTVFQDVLLQREAGINRPSAQRISIPFSEKVDPFAISYTVSHVADGKEASNQVNLRDFPDKLQISSNRTSDSLVIASSNPRNLVFRYFLFRNDRIVESGSSTSLDIRWRVNMSDTYSLSLQYIWAGESRNSEYSFPLDKRNLDIEIDHAAIIYPGQKAKFKVSVRDASGKPVNDVDLTAFAVTKKFEFQSVPSPPSFNNRMKGRAVFNEFKPVGSDLSLSRSLEANFWRKTLGLDSVAFYKLLFPDNGYFEHRSEADISQFSPFAVSRGNSYRIEVVYVDGQPVYFGGTSSIEPYSFHISPGVHTVSLRLSQKLLTLTGVKIEPRQKLIFSIDINHLPNNCQETDRSLQFSDEELNQLSRYFMVVRSRDRYASSFLQQGELYRLVGEKELRYGYGYSEKLVGPFYPGQMKYVHADGIQQTFNYEPFFSFEFRDGQLLMKNTEIKKYLRPGYRSDIPSFREYVLTREAIDSYWAQMADLMPAPFKRFPDYAPTSPRTGRLTLENLPKDINKSAVKATFIVNLNDPDNYSIITGDVQNLLFDAGSYQAVVVLNSAMYLRLDSLQVMPFGNNYYKLDSLQLHKPDTFSIHLLNTIKNWSDDNEYVLKARQQELQKVRQLFYRESTSSYLFDHRVTGQVISAQDGSLLPGVNVIVKGTTIGTITDADGKYTLSCPGNGKLVFSFVGLISVEREINNRSTIDIALESDVTQLQEVVVVGYETRRKNDVAGSVSGQLLGVPGKSIRAPRYRHELQDSVALIIRGSASVQSKSEPLVVLDGIIVRLEDVDRTLFTEMVTIRGDEAVALYGARAAGGVILLSTKTGMTRNELKQLSISAITTAAWETVPGNNLRKNFRDYAFWKPNLRTNSDGTAEFEVTFPDDISGWNTHVIGMRRKLTGQTSSFIKSFKPLVAQIAQPLFLVEGDRAIGVGKITNYTQEEVQLDRLIEINGKVVNKSPMRMKDSKIDSIQLNATGSDTLAVRYSVSSNNFSDGELRTIPVLPQGVSEAKGQFFNLVNDTTFTLSFTGNSDVKLYAQADLLDVLMDEIGFLRTYAYECNEQQASRLMALLLEKKICAYKEIRFTGDREIAKLIRKLTANQNRDGSWSWWGSGEGESLITLHVARSLELAQNSGYPVAMDKQALINYLTINLSNTQTDHKFEMQSYLLEQGEKLFLGRLVDSTRQLTTASLHDKLIVQRLLQLSGGSPDWKLINALRSRSVKGNSYWGEDRISLSDNSISNTLLVYKMIERENPSSKELIDIRNYFLEVRNAHWKNTYESSLILETILPRLLSEKRSASQPTLSLTGVSDARVVQFPFAQTIKGNGTLTVSKSGQFPVYFTAYEDVWNAKPGKVKRGFEVSVRFEDSIKILQAGKPVRYLVDVEVPGDAEYVMIEVPVPAGCYYESKNQFRTNGEVHREYHNHKVNIYCRSLKKGRYTYTVTLLPRFTGSYLVKPAVAECMYFPTIFGRSGQETIDIK